MNMFATFAIPSGVRLDGDSGAAAGAVDGMALSLPLCDRRGALEERFEGEDVGEVLGCSRLRCRNRFMVVERKKMSD